MIAWRCDSRGQLHQLQNYQKRSSYTHCIFRPVAGGQDPFYKFLNFQFLYCICIFISNRNSNFEQKFKFLRSKSEQIISIKFKFVLLAPNSAILGSINISYTSATTQHWHVQQWRVMRQLWTCSVLGTKVEWEIPCSLRYTLN